MSPLFALLFQPELPAWGAARLGVGLPGMGNATVVVYALHPLEVELGVEGSLGHSGTTVRAGPALGIADRRNASGRGLTVHAPMLVGYRFMDFGREYNGHALTLNPTLTADLWLARHLALEFQFTAGASVTLSDRSGGVGVPVFPDLALRAGLAL